MPGTETWPSYWATSASNTLLTGWPIYSAPTTTGAVWTATTAIQHWGDPMPQETSPDPRYDEAFAREVSEWIEVMGGWVEQRDMWGAATDCTCGQCRDHRRAQLARLSAARRASLMDRVGITTGPQGCECQGCNDGRARAAREWFGEDEDPPRFTISLRWQGIPVGQNVPERVARAPERPAPEEWRPSLRAIERERQWRMRDMWDRWVRDARYAWQKREEEEAARRATELLALVIGQEQVDRLTSIGSIEIRTKDGSRYQLNQGSYVGNIKPIELAPTPGWVLDLETFSRGSGYSRRECRELLASGRVGAVWGGFERWRAKAARGVQLCCHLETGAPLHDHYAAQVLHLMTNEVEFLRTANWY